MNDSALIEAILYLESEPLDGASICRIAGITAERTEAALETLRERYANEDSGMELIAISDGFMLSPKKELWEALRERYGKKNEAKLSRAAMETLAIIAYSQPVTRAEIESIRGVQADNMIRILMERNLVRETGKKDIPGKPSQYGTTKEFLRLFRLESIGDLPKLSDADTDKFELFSSEESEEEIKNN
ncbi:MAG: SMC-Scp complex subunit ScpB [Spirochaetaceae bacterium]|jgi:segregation and condensation protein B|nr:SMC-Scp complex subunit ScpB [Spirochaetaceae bacterium]GMO16763.1 MAG: SMC-Scp complex subunit ScpB [Termitinemataceae bacterium]